MTWTLACLKSVPLSAVFKGSIDDYMDTCRYEKRDNTGAGVSGRLWTISQNAYTFNKVYVYRSVRSADMKQLQTIAELQTPKGSNERLFILTRTHSMHIFGEIPFISNRMTASVLKQDPNTKRFKRTLIYFYTDTQYANYRGNPLYQATKRHFNNR